MDSDGFDRLLRRAARHEPEALHALVDMYSGRVYGLLYRLTGSPEIAEDLLQDTFLRLVRRIRDYEHVGKFEPWLFRIAANLARDHARKIKRRGSTLTLDGDQRGEPGVPEPADPTQTDPGRALLREESARRLGEALRELSEMDREIIMLRHFSELPYAEIAEMLEIPLGTALARAHRAMKRLKTLLSEED